MLSNKPRPAFCDLCACFVKHAGDDISLVPVGSGEIKDNLDDTYFHSLSLCLLPCSGHKTGYSVKAQYEAWIWSFPSKQETYSSLENIQQWHNDVVHDSSAVLLLLKKKSP